MTKEETLAYIQAYIDGDTSVENIIPQRSVLESAIKYLSVPSLPSNLDDAAEEWVRPIMRIPDKAHEYLYTYLLDAFKAGAELMAGQGVSADSKVSKLAGRAWVSPINEKQFEQDVYDNFVSGDEVIIQIRKKQ